MILQAGSSTVAAGSVTGVCGDCGADAAGNFCSSCGADLRRSSYGFLGSAVAPVRRSFPVVYLKLLRAPIRGTVAFAEDRSYRNYLSFALSGIALYCLFIVPVVMGMIVPADGSVHVSESLLTLMKVLSQVGVYAGTIITFFLAYGAFRLFSRAPRAIGAYFKLFCIALGFTAPISAAYEFLVVRLLNGTGATIVVALVYQTVAGWLLHVTRGSDFNSEAALAALLTPTAVCSFALVVALLCYSVGIHRRFWHMPVWKAAPLYLTVSTVANQIGFYVMWWVGFYTAAVLIALGIVTR